MNKPIRLLELFGGYGSQALALKRLGVSFEHYFLCEFDKSAVASYNAVHYTNFKPTDIRNISAKDFNIVDTDKYDYLLTYSFPCTDLSTMGTMQGMTKGSGTRSGLLWEVERLLLECGDNLPQFLLMENVPQVHGQNNIKDFNSWIEFLDSLGYKSKWCDLNAKDYGVAQNRVRCFMVSWLQKGFTYMFPEPIKLIKTTLDYLETDVDDKYYVSPAKAKKLIDVFNSDRHGPTWINENKLAATLNTEIGTGTHWSQYVREKISDTEYKIRNLTPLECFRLMGVTDDEAERMISVNSKTQCYKQAGNSIVVDVMVHIFDNLFNEKENLPGQMTIYDYM